MIRLAGHDVCTGCGACAFRCPQQCISMQEDALGVVFPTIDNVRCVECHSCENVCPILNEVHSRIPVMAYAAWSKDIEERRTSASGGIAIEMYKYGVLRGWLAVGAVQNKDFTVSHRAIASINELAAFKNSKYVFSDIYAVLPEISKAVKNGQKILFIGLPCQVAALRKLFRDEDCLILVELVCHGVPPASYLMQHIDFISKQENQTAASMSFRDPACCTYKYVFSLYNRDKVMFYAKGVEDGDSYQFGYHRAVIYRENCYSCHFMKPERNSDITIADYFGLGLSAPCKFSQEKVSLILENTEKGKVIVQDLIDSGHIYAEMRPLEEPSISNPQLVHPIGKNKYRLLFEKEIVENKGDFEKAIRKPWTIYKWDLQIKHLVLFPRRIAHVIKTRILNKK